MAEKSASNLIDGIEASKNIPFSRVLFALGIRYVGETVAKKLAKHFKSIDNLSKASYEELIEVDEIGGSIAQSIVDFFGNSDSLVIIDKLRSNGLQLAIDESLYADTTDTLKGKAFVVSGVFATISRNDLKSTY